MFNKEKIELLVKAFVARTETEETIKNRRILISEIIFGKVDNNKLTKFEIEQGLKVREEELIKIIESRIFTAAVKICMENNFCSTVLLQKSFNIGFSKAIAIIDAMEALKLVEPFVSGVRNRKLLPAIKDFKLDF